MSDKYGSGMGIKKAFDKAAEAVATAAKNYVNKSSVSRSAKGSPNLGDAAKAIRKRKLANQRAAKKTD
jgi:hypothetical protein